MEKMSYDQAIRFIYHRIYVKQCEIDKLKECIKYLENDKL